MWVGVTEDAKNFSTKTNKGESKWKKLSKLLSSRKRR